MDLAFLDNGESEEVRLKYFDTKGPLFGLSWEGGIPDRIEKEVPLIPTSWGGRQTQLLCTLLPEQAVQTDPAQQQWPVFASDSRVVSSAA